MLYTADPSVKIRKPLRLKGPQPGSRVLLLEKRPVGRVRQRASTARWTCGNIFGVGPGGVYVFTPTGRMLAWINCAGNVGSVVWGEDGSTLFIAANSAVYRVRLSTRGAGWEGAGVERAAAMSR